MMREKGDISLAPFFLSEIMVKNNYLNCNISRAASVVCNLRT